MNHVDTMSRRHLPHPSPISPTDTVSHVYFSQEDTADAFFRIVANVDTEVASFRVQVTQSRDSDKVTIREKLEQGPVEGFLLADGLVFRDNPNVKPQLLVPIEMQDNEIV